ncbi:molybdopterin oxidoreductase family protein [Mycolicibacterium aichiense]|uniref:Dehydrogenase n=1 Tax=Mycolicibacterium aichiense TaxID=1799 RepID=A0AAD1HXR4_9MYCO|nr:molybdopterin oxidoreductase family protein [Mycolicibacterium aichiense]MCV7016977.1 molybdopterin-dependent oxidoreductase [Mycolicibacterium aichiense]BBX10596.1 dehydrogenase [Mycolicibacterium aichiense]STZ25746.1 molydopterin dinucleotide-binding region [Mycolicibacterium aichiense]
MSRTALRICPFCEATCGMVLTIDDNDRVSAARGDRDDVFSHGFICPKGASFPELDNDPDRLQKPLVRRDGELVETSWADAFAAAAEGLQRVIADTGGSSVAVYLGNPNAHTIAGSLYGPVVIKSLGTRQVYSASTLDQMPKHVSCGYLFGNPLAFTLPDLDRTDYLVVMGANPLVSNGSLATAADFPGKLKALRRRGGTLVVIDPNRTRTAELADRHIAPRPGTDAALLFAVAQVLFDEDLVDLGRLAGHVSGLERVRAAAQDFPPEAVAEHCGVDADEIRTLARELAAAPSAAVYGRIGTSTVGFGTLTSWLVDVVNILTGNLDRPGGVMFASSPIAGAPRPPRPGRGFATGRWRSRVSGHPEALSELPAVALAEEIETPGEGQVKAMITIAGNPVLSAPDGARLSEALDGVGFMVSVDPYLNETTRHADVILPPPPPSRAAHYDLALSGAAVRNNARYSPPVLPLPEGRPDECEILARLALIVLGMGPDADPALVDEQVIATTLGKEVADEHSPVAGRSVEELTAMLPEGRGFERRLDMMLRLGPFGDGFGAKPDGLTLQRLKDTPHGVDLGALTPRIPEILRTPSGTIELDPEPILADVPRLQAALTSEPGFLLIGRRHLRSNNSWMHNLPALSGGTNRCTLQIHPDDAARLGLEEMAVVTGPGGKLEVPVEITDAIRPGVVSLPHGWGHTEPGTRMRVAAQHPGVNVNNLNDGTLLDPLSGTAVLNALPVEVAPAG